MIIHAEPLTPEAFQPFGHVIQTAGQAPVLINEGNTEKFADLAKLVAGEGGRMGVHVYRSQPVSHPVTVRMMERHPLGSQAFIPLHQRPFPVLVAPGSAKPDMTAARLFLSDGFQGINIGPGIWHHYQMSLGQVSDYLVIDRLGPGTNFEEYHLPGAITLSF